MDAIRSTGLWGMTLVVALSCALGWPSTEYESMNDTLQLRGQHANRNCFPGIEKSLANLQRSLDELDRKVETALHDHAQCAGRSDVAAVAGARLEQLRREKVVMEQRILEVRIAVERERQRRVTISADCLDNPLGKGCM